MNLIERLSAAVQEAMANAGPKTRAKKPKHVPGKLGLMFREKMLNTPQRLATRYPERCGVCDGPAIHHRGRSSGKTFVCPVDCGHPAYLLETGPQPRREMTTRELFALLDLSRDHERETRLNLDPPGQDKRRRRG